jgi:hypothetical protein
MKTLLAAIRFILTSPFMLASFICIWLAVMLGLIGVVISELCDE